MENSRVLKLYENVTKARNLEVELLDYNAKEVVLRKKIEELESIMKTKKSFFRFGKRNQNDYELSQAKESYNIAVENLSNIQHIIRVKSSELSGLQESKEELSRIYEKRLTLVRLSEQHKEKLRTLESSYLLSLKRKEFIPEAAEKAWRLQYQIQNINLILRQAVEAYNAAAASNYSPYNKLERIDKAKEETQIFEKMLHEFQMMLSEMDLKFDMQVDTKNFVSYAPEGNTSFWTDSRILSLQVREQLEETLKEFNEKEVQIDIFRKELIEMKKNCLRTLYESQNRLEEFVLFLN